MSHTQMGRPPVPALRLKAREVKQLRALVRARTVARRVYQRARVLLLAAEGLSGPEVARGVGVQQSTVWRIRTRYEQGGLDRALYDVPHRRRPKKLTEATAAKITAMVCSAPPEGHARWTVSLVAEQVKHRKIADVGRTAVYKRLREDGLKPWREKNVVRP